MHRAVRYETYGTKEGHVDEHGSVLGAAMSVVFSTLLHSFSVILSRVIKEDSSYESFIFFGKKNQLNLLENVLGRANKMITVGPGRIGQTFCRSGIGQNSSECGLGLVRCSEEVGRIGQNSFWEWVGFGQTFCGKWIGQTS